MSAAGSCSMSAVRHDRHPQVHPTQIILTILTIQKFWFRGMEKAKSCFLSTDWAMIVQGTYRVSVHQNHSLMLEIFYLFPDSPNTQVARLIPFFPFCFVTNCPNVLSKSARKQLMHILFMVLIAYIRHHPALRNILESSMCTSQCYSQCSGQFIIDLIYFDFQ